MIYSCFQTPLFMLVTSGYDRTGMITELLVKNLRADCNRLCQYEVCRISCSRAHVSVVFCYWKDQVCSAFCSEKCWNLTFYLSLAMYSQDVTCPSSTALLSIFLAQQCHIFNDARFFFFRFLMGHPFSKTLWFHDYGVCMHYVISAEW